MSAASSLEPVSLEAGELGVVLSCIKQDDSRWRKKVWLLQALGRYGRPRRISVWDLAQEAGVNHGLARELMTELVASRVVLILERRRGRLATLWVANAAIAAWGATGTEVPWRREVGTVIALVHRPDEVTKPRLRAALAPAPRATPGSARLSSRSRAKWRWARGPQPRAARKPTGSARPSPLDRAQTDADALAVEDLPTGVGLRLASRPASASEEEAAEAHVVRVKRMKGIIVRAAAPDPRKGVAYLGGADNLVQLEELARVVDVGWVAERCTVAPKHLMAPKLLDWLEDQAYLPGAELIAALDARPDQEPTTDAGQGKGDEPAAPKLEEFTGYREDDPFAPSSGETKAEALARIKAWQDSRVPPADGTLGEATGGA